MKVHSIKYSRLKSGTNFSNESVGVEVVLEEFDTVDDCMKNARAIVARELGDEVSRPVTGAEYDEARNFIDEHNEALEESGDRLSKAKETVQRWRELHTDIPF